MSGSGVSLPLPRISFLYLYYYRKTVEEGANAEAGAAALEYAAGIPSPTHTVPREDSVDHEQDAPVPSSAHQPMKYRLTDEMKVLVALSNDCCKLENEKK